VFGLGLTVKKGIFITGTDTGVGKTYVAAGIAEQLRQDGVDVGVMKPAETGCAARAGKLVPRDAKRLIKAAGVTDSLELVNPVRMRKPLALLVAAAMEGLRIDPRDIQNAFQTLASRHEYMIVEGAGGIMVPIAPGYSFLDLAQEMGLPVLIVARPSLGTINHTLLTVKALKDRGLAIAGIVINYADDRRPGLAEKTSPAVIEEISGVKVLGTMRHASRSFSSIVAFLS
jgi:dethiobiotin synthetase